MKEKLRVDVSRALAKLRPTLSWLRSHRLWVECATLTLLGLLAAFSLGYAALSRTSTLNERVADLQRIDAAFDRWTTQLQHPGTRERSSWRESEQSLRSLGAEAAEPLSLAQVVSQRAQEVGISELSIRLLSADSVAPIPSVQLGSWSVQAGSIGLVVEFDGNMGDVVGFLGALPPQAAVSNLQVTPTKGALHARIVLMTRQVVGAG